MGLHDGTDDDLRASRSAVQNAGASQIGWRRWRGSFLIAGACNDRPSTYSIQRVQYAGRIHFEDSAAEGIADVGPLVLGLATEINRSPRLSMLPRGRHRGFCIGPSRR